MNDLESRLKELRDAREKARKANDKAERALRIAVWVNLFNFGFQSCNLIHVLTH